MHPITALQTEYSLWERDAGDRGLPGLRASWASASSPYSPLGRGFLTGQFRSLDDFAADDFRRHSPRFQGENFDRNLQLVDRVKEWRTRRAARRRSWRWPGCWPRASTSFPSPAPRSVDRLRENLGAADVELSAEDLTRLDELAPAGVAAGARYPHMDSIDV